ncbi:MAG TPA: hypothetical protein VML75_22825 [Kofleriaceae bacterium]|nr:hypothetical protein [Kofleriaceae bacterium]
MSKRPGGLTALAVMNFVFGGFGGILALIQMATISAGAEVLAEGQASGEIPSNAVLYAFTLGSLVSAALLITAGIGYLGLKRFLGRAMGNAYVAVSLASTIAEFFVSRSTFSVGTLVFMVYPIITVALINLTFREDFFN